MKTRLAQDTYLAFPLVLTATGAAKSGREQHIREQILQTLFTTQRERVFRHSFGGGVRALVFSPSSLDGAGLTQQHLTAALSDVLAGEVDPRTLSVSVEGEDNTITIRVSYQIAAIQRREEHTFTLTPDGAYG